MSIDSRKDSNLARLRQLKQDFLQRYYSNTKAPKMVLDDFLLYRKIGKGAFAAVYYSVDAQTKLKPYAIKVLNKAKVVHDRQVEHVKSERRLLDSLRSNFIVVLHHYFQDSTNLYLALEFVQGGELFKFIRERLYFGEDTAKFYAMQMILAIEYLHLLDIVYRDLKPENILITASGYLKLTDFGFAKLMIDNRTYTLCGTPEYLAPEIILNKGYGRAVDWWGIGVFIYELLGGYTPFYDSDTKHIYEKIVLCKYKFPVHFSSEAKSLITKLLEPDLTRRFGNLRRRADDIKRHGWFFVKTSCSWSSIYNQTQILPKEIASHKIPEIPKLPGDYLSLFEHQLLENDRTEELFANF